MTGHPFHPSYDDRIITLIMTVVIPDDATPLLMLAKDYGGEDKSNLELYSVAFHILASKLRQIIRRYPPGEEHDIPWSDWGPTCCRAEPMNEGFPRGASSAMVGSLRMRLVRQCIEPFDGTLYSRYIDPDSDTDYPDLRLRGFDLYDFNQAAIAHALAASGNLHEYVFGPEDAETVAPLSLGDGYEYYARPTRLPAGYQALFKEEVWTGLPYRKHRIGIRVRSPGSKYDQAAQLDTSIPVYWDSMFDSVALSENNLYLTEVRTVRQCCLHR